MDWKKNKYRKEEELPLFTQHPVELAQETKVNSYRQLTSNPVKLETKRQLVLGVLLMVAQPDNLDVEKVLQDRSNGALAKLDSLSNEEIAKFLGFPVNRVVGRTFELRQFGFVTAAKKRACLVTGHIVQTWRVTSDEERELFKQRA